MTNTSRGRGLAGLFNRHPIACTVGLLVACAILTGAIYAVRLAFDADVNRVRARAEQGPESSREPKPDAAGRLHVDEVRKYLVGKSQWEALSMLGWSHNLSEQSDGKVNRFYFVPVHDGKGREGKKLVIVTERERVVAVRAYTVDGVEF